MLSTLTDEEGWLSVLESTQVIYYYHGNTDAMMNAFLRFKSIFFPTANPYEVLTAWRANCLHLHLWHLVDSFIRSDL